MSDPTGSEAPMVISPRRVVELTRRIARTLRGLVTKAHHR